MLALQSFKASGLRSNNSVGYLGQIESKIYKSCGCTERFDDLKSLARGHVANGCGTFCFTLEIR